VKTMLVGLFALTLVSCSTFSDRANEMRVEANRCTGIITLNVQRRVEDEKMSYTCEWNNSDE
jgi:hypothetical protein